MTSAIPPHYSNRYVQQRYNKALQIVQHLPSSSFQPTKEQKLQLYAFYKQVSIGNVNTARPGLFDMVGRAKWDAWKKLEGFNKLEAQHCYVDILLQAVSEAYQKPASKIQAQQIIQTFSMMKPIGDDDDTTDDEMTTTTEDGDHADNGSSVASVDEEEKAYLFDIQQNAGRSTPSTLFGQSELTTSTSPRKPLGQSNIDQRSWNGKQRQFLRPKSSASLDRIISSASPNLNRTTNINNDLNKPMTGTTSRAASSASRYRTHVLPRDSSTFNDHHFDDTMNPWASGTQQPLHHSTLSDYQQHPQLLRTDSRSTNHTNMSAAPMLPSPVMGSGRLRTLQSPFHGSSAASSVTATASNVRTLQQNQQLGRRQEIQPTPTPSVISQHSVALGPATKQALESLQTEVIALNDRIDDLRHELIWRDRRRAEQRLLDDKSEGNGEGDGWQWVIKAAIKHAAVNLLTALIILLILYKRGNPAAYAAVGQFSKLWYRLRGWLRVTTVVV
ncbi:acyl CoA binding protein-domain-containing protein [Absidia repens]|uniref:Acyl CoA binding protein-domain-containing protein n=1 Tax=Absidia repens TaxID=90262 RepID=A0A1X2IUY2_9FUNG|nr:acyl CoA binding protein-domain-containing protein [Absidia repens]